MPPNEMEDGENKMFAQRHRARKLKATDTRGSQPLHSASSWLNFVLPSVVLRKIPETYMQGRAKKSIRMSFR